MNLIEEKNIKDFKIVQRSQLTLFHLILLLCSFCFESLYWERNYILKWVLLVNSFWLRGLWVVSLENPSSVENIILIVFCFPFFPWSYRGLNHCKQLTDIRCFVHNFQNFTQFLQNLVENMLNLVQMVLVVLPLKTEVCCWTAWYKLTAKLFCYLFLLNSDFFAWKLAPSTLLSSCFLKIFLGITPKKCWSDFREPLRGLVLLAHLFRVFLILSCAFFLIYLRNFCKI